jgi:hypothetical protein
VLERLRTLTIHHGRHTFISHALAGGRTLAEVRDAAGHSNVSVTSGYLHIAVDDGAAMGTLFGGRSIDRPENITAEVHQLDHPPHLSW